IRKSGGGRHHSRTAAAARLSKDKLLPTPPRVSRIHASSSVPTRPQTVNVAVMQPENRIIRGGLKRRNNTADVRVYVVVQMGIKLVAKISVRQHVQIS